MPTDVYVSGASSIGTNWLVPVGVSSANFESFGGGGGGAGTTAGGGGGGGGGGYCKKTAQSVVSGDLWNVNVQKWGDAGSPGNDGWPPSYGHGQVFVTKGGVTPVLSFLGEGGKTSGAGGHYGYLSSYGSASFVGGSGGTVITSTGGGGGASSAGTGSNGNDGKANSLTVGGAGGAAPTGGFAGSAGGNVTVDGVDGVGYGAGGGGGGGVNRSGGHGGPGAVIISYTAAAGGLRRPPNLDGLSSSARNYVVLP